MCKVLKRVISILVLAWACLPCFSNNVRLKGTVEVTGVTSEGVATLEVDLTWDNSWRDNFNWDAVWLFLKYKPASGEWQPVYLQATGTEVSSGYQVMHGNNDGTIVGVYVFLDGNGTKQQASTKVTLKWNCGTRYTKADFDENRVFLLAQGIEMVYIPFGAYYLGDGVSANTLGAADGKPLVMNSEEATTLYQRASNGTGTAINLNADYPKGYYGFYVMKYETSQEQYVTFLNTLTKAQQEELLGSSLSALSPGNYIFGSASQPSYRNGIVLSAKPEGQPYVFDNDLNGNGVYGEDGDGQCVACNYMSLYDVMAYAGWAGLRPMGELEYERICRAPFPQKPVEREYVWNSNSGISRVTSITAKGKETEVADNMTCNVNSGNGLTGNDLGPVRCGLFARSNSTQLQAGATFWGVMEMGGNVQEIVANVKHTNLKWKVNNNGYGNYGNMWRWCTTLGEFGVRGGSFTGADSLLRTSDRSKISYFSSWVSRDSTVGFRLVRTLDEGVETVNPGAISLSGPLCPGAGSTVPETAAASVAGGLPITYIWSYSTNNGSTWTVIPDATGNELTYSAFVPGWTYLFRRTAVCALGEASTLPTTGITASALTVITRQPVDTVDAQCSMSIDVTATGTSLTYQWEKDGVAISDATSATYAKNPTELSDRGHYVCKVTGACGTVYSNDVLAVAVEHQYEDDEFIDTRDNQRYKIRKMPDGHWWMIENLRFGNCNASTFNTYHQQSTQNRIWPSGGYYGVCRPASSDPADGNLYNWQAAMNDAGAFYNNTGSDSNPSGNTNDTTMRQWQGICPPGWHLPSGGPKGEFRELSAALCNRASNFNSGGVFEGVMCGYGSGSSLQSSGSSGWYWSSTWFSMVHAYHLYFDSNRNVSPQSANPKNLGFAVRCVKNY